MPMNDQEYSQVNYRENYWQHATSYRQDGLGSRSYIAIPVSKQLESMGIEDTMGFIKFRVKIRIAITTPRFISGIAEDIYNAVGKIASDAVKVVGNVATVTVKAYEDIKNSVVAVMPPFLRPYIEIALSPIGLVLNPGPTLNRIEKSISELSKDIQTGFIGKAFTDIYQDVARPAFRIARNVAGEIAIMPLVKIVDAAAIAFLPSDLRDKVSAITNIPERAVRGTLRDQDIAEGVEAAVQIGMIPAKVTGQFNNEVIAYLKKDKLLGRFLTEFDKYSGGLLTSVENLNKLPSDIYHDRNINWKQVIVDGLKIYLASMSVAALKQQLATQVIGDKTGLKNTAIGRSVMAAGAVYYATYSMSPAELAKAASQNSDLAANQLLYAAKQGAIQTAKAEMVTEAVKKGYVGDAYAARMIISAGGRFYDAGADQNLMGTMSEVYDAEFQDLAEHVMQKETGLPIKFDHLVDVYNTNWSELYKQVADGMSRLNPFSTAGGAESDQSFLAKMGNNFINEINRMPNNASKISQNVIDELSRTPENMAKFASAVVNEVDRTPENLAKIANNIAAESQKAAQNVVAEVERTPDNVNQALDNIARESERAIDNIAKEIDRIDPKATLPSVDIEDLLNKYGPTVIALLQERHGYQEGDPITGEMMTTVFGHYKKKSNFAFWLLGGLVVAAGVVVATED